eukprot:275739-Pleurochrysis_carterae.AAC.1
MLLGVRDLTDNDISGTIPPLISELTSLLHLCAASPVRHEHCVSCVLHWMAATSLNCGLASTLRAFAYVLAS